LLFLEDNQASFKLLKHPKKHLMNRQETVSLLKEIIAVCGSFYDARAVSIQNDGNEDSWELHVYWVPNPSETECLQKILAHHNLEMITINEHSVFRSKKHIQPLL
jgi:hypothetical protein